MEAQNGRPFEEGDPVNVADRGPGTIAAVNRETKMYVVTPAEEGAEPWADVPETALTYREGVDGPQAAAGGAGDGAEEESDGGYLDEPPSVFDELGEMQAEARRDDTKTIELLPGRFKGRLAVRCRRLDPKKRKKKVRKIAKRGVTDEAELQYAAEIIADATEAVLVRMKDSDKLVEAQKVTAEFGDEPVRFDQRLGMMLKMEGQLTGTESAASIVRLVFKNPEALDAFYQELDLWLREAAPTEDEDEDEDGDGEPSRPI